MLIGSYAPSLVNFRGPLISAMIAAGCEVIAAAPEMDDRTSARLRELGAQPIQVAIDNTGISPVGMAASYRQLRRVFAERRPDLILSYTIKPVILTALAARAAGSPRIVSLITGLGFAFTGDAAAGRRFVRAMASWLYRLARRRSEIVIFQNEDDRSFFRELGLVSARTPTAVVDGSGVDIDHFKVEPLPAAPSFLMIARLLGDKGVREFAAAARRVKIEHPEVPIALVGYLDRSPDSLTRSELDELIAAGIDFRGKLDDVRPAIAQSSVYVLPSYREGTPRSVLEAMAMGRAIITTDAPGCRETVIEGVNGFLVPPRDADSLYAAMKRLILDPERIALMGVESRRIAESRYDARKVSAAIMRHAGL